MKEMSKQQRTIAYVAGGLILAYLAYRWYASRQTVSTTAGAAAPDTSSGDYAALAGQEQADVAALQGQNSQLLSQEQSDVSGLEGAISGLTATVGGWTDQINSIITGQHVLGQDVAALATGQQKIDRSLTVHTKKGTAFYKYYVKVTGKPPPVTLSTSNLIYQGFKSGVSATGLKSVVHPSSKNTQIAHPNGNHQQQSHVAPTSTKTTPAPSTKPSGGQHVTPGNRTAVKPPPAPTKPKPSGKRK